MVDPFGLSECGFSKKISGQMPDPYKGVKEASEYLKKMGVDRDTRKQIIRSFTIETIKVEKAGMNQFGSRFFDHDGARPMGQYLFETFTPQTNRVNLALPPVWNKMEGVKQWQIKEGTTMIIGKAAPQFEQGSQYVGGAEQIFVLAPWKYGSLF